MGGNKAKKRRSLGSSKSRKAKKVKTGGGAVTAVSGSRKTVEPGPAGPVAHEGIVVDVDPEDDDEFVKTLVKIKKTQINLNCRHESRVTTTTMSNYVDKHNVHNLIPLTVQVLSVEAIFKKYGKYLAVPTDKSEGKGMLPDAEAGVTQKSEPEDAKNKIDVPNNTPSSLPSPRTNVNQIAESEITIDKDEPIVTQLHDLPDELPASTAPVVIVKPKKKKSKKSKKRTKIRIRKTPVGAAAASCHSSDNSISTIPTPELPTEDTDPPLLPKRVTLKKNLINQMMHRLVKSRNPPPSPSREDIEIIEAKEEDKVVPEVIQIDIDVQDGPECSTIIESAQVLCIQENVKFANFAPLIPKEELDIKYEEADDFVVPKIEGICHLPASHQNNALDNENSSDDDRVAEDDFLADPDFDPNESTEESENEEVHSNPPEKEPTKVTPNPSPTPSSLTTCETCNLRFLSAPSFKIHMKECHNDYTLSDDEEQMVPCVPAPPPVPPSRTHFNCKICLLPFATLVGLKLHTNTKHMKTPVKPKGAPKILPKESPAEIVLDPPPPPKPIAEKVVYVCSFPDCDLPFSSMQNMKIHKSLQHEPHPQKSIRCILCSATVVQAAALLYHLRNRHPGALDEEGYQEFARVGVSIKKSSPPNSVLEEFRKTAQVEADKNTRETPTCTVCNISFQWEANLKSHMKLYHDGVASSVVGNKQKSTRKEDSSPLLSAALNSGPLSQINVQREYEPKSKESQDQAEVIDLSGADDDKIQTPRASKRILPKPSSAGKKSFNTMCPYCTKSISAEDFGSHLETHADLTSAKKFSCPFSGCRETFNLFQEVQAHHKVSHQGKCSVPSGLVTRVHGRSPRRSSDPDGPSRAFICGVCDNVTFSSFEILEEHCQLMHPDTARARRGIQPAMGATKTRSRTDRPSSSTLTVTPLSNIGPTGSTYALRRVQSDPLENHNVSRMAGIRAEDFDDKNQADSTMQVTPLARIGPMESTYAITQVQHDPLDVTGSHSQVPALEVLPLLIPSQFRCCACGRTNFLTQGELDIHTLEHQGIQVTKRASKLLEPLIHEDCDPLSASDDSRNLHSTSVHEGLKGIVSSLCPICKLEIHHSRNVPRHVLTVHKMWLCKYCPQLFKEETQKTRHMELHYVPFQDSVAGKPTYRCQECLEVFTSVNSISQHYATMHHGGDKCTCVTCNIQLQRKNLKTHLELHQQEKSVAASDPRSTSHIHKFIHSRLRTLLVSDEEHQESAAGGIVMGMRDEFPRDEAQGQYPQGRKGLPSLVPIPQTGAAERDVLSETIIPDADPLQLDPLVEHGEDGESVHFINPSYQASQFEFEEVTIIEDQQGESETQNRGETVRDLGDDGVEISPAMFPDCVITPSVDYSGFGNAEDSYCSTEFEGSTAGTNSRREGLSTGNPPSDPAKKLIYRCGQCPKLFPQNHKREEHIKRVHQNPTSSECAICGEYYRNDIALSRHINQTHRTDEMFKVKQSVKRKRSNNPAKAPVPLKPPTTVPKSDPPLRQYSGMEFRNVMDRRKHELINLESRLGTEDSRGAAESRSRSSSEVAQEQNGGVFYEDGGSANPENIFLPLGMMMKTDMETTMATGAIKGEN